MSFEYNKKILNIFKAPKHVGEIKNPSGYSLVGNPRCGDQMEVFIKVKDEIIIDAKFRTLGCIAAISTSDALCELAIGKKVDEALKLTHEDIINFLGDIPKIKIHCSVLGKEALHKAIENYKSK